MLASGEAQMANYGLDAALIAGTRDASFVMVGSPVNKGTFALIARKGIVKPEDLRGQRISVGRVGDAPYFHTVSLLKKWGIGARDVQWVSAGGEPAARVVAMTGGLADAALFAAPAWFRLVDAHGFVNLGSLAEHDDIFVSVVYLFRRDAIAADPALPERLIKAHAEAVKRFYEDKAFATSAFRKHDPKASPADTERLYDLVARDRVLERVPFVLRDAIESAAERGAQANPHLKGADFRKVVDNGTVLRLAHEGYFERLFGPSIAAEQAARRAKAYGV
jgi:ABC-type nitrate/sulfonate/bicarbonate transport system substrate-binding protein